ncbi:MAG: DUF6353 family protein [Chitinophagales bacterium]
MKGENEMIDINKAKNIVMGTFGRSTLVLRKFSPEICLGLGIVGGITATVLACGATLKVNEVTKNAKDTLQKIEDVANEHAEIGDGIYTEDDRKKDITIVYAQEVVALGKLYGPAVILGIVSIGLIIGSHRILTKRNAALVAAYKVVDGAFKRYRQQVVNELGLEKDQAFRYELKTKTFAEKVIDEETGKETSIEKTVATCPPCMFVESEYARFFDDSSPNWQHDHTHNLFFLSGQQNFANDLLNTRGHVFLNEVYDMLGIPRSKAGTIVGWVKDNKKGDGYIDFGTLNPANDRNRDFVNGYNMDAILLDFNVDGVIWELI